MLPAAFLEPVLSVLSPYSFDTPWYVFTPDFKIIMDYSSS